MKYAELLLLIESLEKSPIENRELIAFYKAKKSAIITNAMEKAFCLDKIEKAKQIPTMEEAKIFMWANRISYQITNAEPNVIRYWVTEYKIQGKIAFNTDNVK